MPRKKTIDGGAAAALGVTAADATRDVFPDGVPLNPDGTLDEDAEMSAEEIQQLGAASAESAQLNTARSRFVHRKKIGDRNIKWNSREAMDIFDVVRMTWPAAHFLLHITREEPDPQVEFPAAPMSGMRSSAELYQYIMRRCHRRSRNAKYRVIFKEGTTERGRGFIWMPDTTMDDPDEPHAAPPVPAYTPPSPYPQGMGAPWAPQQAWPPPPWQQQQPPQAGPPAQAPAIPPPPPLPPGASPELISYSQSLREELLRMHYQQQQQQLQAERMLGELTAMRQAYGQGYGQPHPQGVGAPPPFVAGPGVAPAVPPPPPIPYGAPPPRPAPAPAPPAAVVSALTPLQSMRQSAQEVVGIWETMQGLVRQFGGPGGVAGVADNPIDAPVDPEPLSPVVTQEVKAGDKTVSLSYNRENGGIHWPLTIMGVVPVLAETLKDVVSQISNVKRQEQEMIRAYRNGGLQVPSPPPPPPPLPPAAQQMASAVPSATELAALLGQR